MTASLTLIDVHDIARSARTYGVKTVYIAHPSPALQRLTNTLKNHWEEGFGSTYNPNRKEAIETIDVVNDLDDIVEKLEQRAGKPPKLIASSAHPGENRTSFQAMREIINGDSNQTFLLMLGTGWGMSNAILSRADYFLEPISGPTAYNHLSVRSACAIMLDRLLAPR